MKKKRIMALLLAGGLICGSASQISDVFSLGQTTAYANDEFNNYDFTNEDFYNMMLKHENQINEMLKSENAYLAREGKDSYSFELSGFKEWNENDLTNILEITSNYLQAMKTNQLYEAQKNGNLLVENIGNSIVELAFIAEDNRYNTLTEQLDKGTGSITEEEGKIIYIDYNENGIDTKYIYSSVGNNNSAFNTLLSFDLSAYSRDKSIILDESPVDLTDFFLDAISKDVYNPTLYNRTALNLIWKEKDGNKYPLKVRTEWFYDNEELQNIYLEGFNKVKSDLGLNPEDYSIIVDNEINGFRLQKKDGTIEYIIKDSQEIPWIVLTELCNIQGLSKATSYDNLNTFDTSVDYSDSFNTVSSYLEDNHKLKILRFEKY